MLLRELPHSSVEFPHGPAWLDHKGPLAVIIPCWNTVNSGSEFWAALVDAGTIAILTTLPIGDSLVQALR